MLGLKRGRGIGDGSGKGESGGTQGWVDVEEV
jgi:hypothetical protein